MIIYMLQNGEFRLYQFRNIDLEYIGWNKIQKDNSQYWVTKDNKLAHITAKITKAKIKILA